MITEENVKLTKLQRGQWTYSICQLRKHFNPGVRVRVASYPLSGICGDCNGIIKLRRLVEVKIRINSNRAFNERYDTLMHEWAHAMEWEANWEDGSAKRTHGPGWGVWYAAIYEHLYEKCWADMARKGLIDEIQMKLFSISEYE